QRVPSAPAPLPYTTLFRSQRQRIELAQIATHAAQLSAENQQLRRLLSVADMVVQPSVAVEVLYEPPNAFTRHLVFDKGRNSGILDRKSTRLNSSHVKISYA